ncbi:endonuclease/exonuclease/phosphatase family protein [Pseudovibrio exalbescens]|uniref:endonuclease/exonuclease/phosphatase family protein n=1 Tax=Pseudovibrio exalbescens TaxID=197461 RepID=UPI0023657C39|nr:endonuclease/exonuclease/phosphatase family protein [Pseudovibrio exalbescens]MDD7910216.1 endonuclease/exonuclease/phosphatase family protein [Pseudovibrio exalbescens]
MDTNSLIDGLRAKLKFIARCFVAFSWFLALCVALAYWLPGYYISEAAAFFAPQFIFISIAITLLACILCRSLGYTTPVLAALWLTLGLATHDKLLAVQPPALKDGQEQALTLLSLNLEHFRYDDAALRTLIDTRKPDLILFQETAASALRLQSLLSQDYPHAIVPEAGQDTDLTAFSKLPIKDIVFHAIDETPVHPTRLDRYLRFTVDTVLGPVRVYSVHPHSPHTPGKLRARTQYMTAVAEDVTAYREAAEMPYIVAGDWNTSPWSRSFAMLLDEMQVTTRFEGGFPRNTRYFFMPELSDLFGSQVDHIAVSKDLGIRDVKVEPNIGSDHLPLLATITMAPKNEDSAGTL